MVKKKVITINWTSSSTS